MKIWIPFILITFAMIWLLITLILRHHDTVWQKITLFSAWIYAFFICRICFAPEPFYFIPTHNIHYFWVHGMIVNLIPFQDLSIAFWLNIVMTIPAGIFYALILHPKRVSSILGLSLATGLVIETTQFIINWFVNLGRWVEVDDLITNAIGVLIGLGVVYLLNQTKLRNLIKKLEIAL